MSDNLLKSGIVFGIFLIVFGVIISIRLLIKIINKQNSTNKTDRIIGVILGSIMIVSGAYISLLEYNLLTNYKYVEGTIYQYCDPNNYSNKKVKFEYFFEGKKYSNCNKYPPELENKIKVPGGKYQVRVSSFKPDGGRMDFEKPIK